MSNIKVGDIVRYQLNHSKFFRVDSIDGDKALISRALNPSRVNLSDIKLVESRSHNPSRRSEMLQIVCALAGQTTSETCDGIFYLMPAYDCEHLHNVKTLIENANDVLNQLDKWEVGE